MGLLLEREGELAELRAAVGETADGGGRLVVVEAQGGLGKTRLLQAARELGAGAGWRDLGARATELERDFPFAVVRQLFEPHLAALDARERETLVGSADDAALRALGLTGDGPAAADPGSGDTFTVLHGLYRLTAALAERQPLLLAIDDAHWADDASLDYVGFLITRLDGLPLRLVVAARPDEDGAAPGVARIAADVSARRLQPRALSLGAATTLLTAELGTPPAPAFAATCHEASGGNPFLLCELARTLAQQQISPGAEQAPLVGELAPERVRHTVALRLARRSPDARAFARALVVAGDDGDGQLVAALARLGHDAAPRAADELRAAAILDPDAHLRFIHPLVRNAVRSELRAGELAAEHARAAALLRERGATAEQLAAHLVAAPLRGDRETVELLLEAGTRALASGAPRSAIAYLMRALREPSPPELRQAVLHPLITAAMRASDYTVYAEIEADLLDVLQRDPTLLSRWATKLSTWMALNGRFDQAVALLQQAIEVEVHGDDLTRAFRLEAQLVGIAQVPFSEARRRLEPYCARFERDSAGGRLAAALNAQWCVFDGGTAADAVRWARQTLDGGAIMTEQTGFIAPGWALVALLMADQLEETKQLAEIGVAIARSRSATPELVGSLLARGMAALRLGDLATAEPDIRQAIDVARHGGLMAALPLLTATLVETLVERGELDAAERVLEAFHAASGPLPDNFWFGPLRMNRGRLRLAQGRPRPAVEDFEALLAHSLRHGVAGGPAAPIRWYAAPALLAIGEPQRARELAEQGLAEARHWGAPSTISNALRALALTVGGTNGIALLEEAAGTVADSPARLERAHALGELGAALRRGNRRAAARAPLREALDLARRCGAAGLARATSEELEACGERIRRHTPIGVASLTPSERRVAEMAATGMTNKRIAEQLVLTVKTIESHLSAAYDKLGIRSRRQLPDALSTPPEGSAIPR